MATHQRQDINPNWNSFLLLGGSVALLCGAVSALIVSSSKFRNQQREHKSEQCGSLPVQQEIIACDTSKKQKYLYQADQFYEVAKYKEAVKKLKKVLKMSGMSEEEYTAIMLQIATVLKEGGYYKELVQFVEERNLQTTADFALILMDIASRTSDVSILSHYQTVTRSTQTNTFNEILAEVYVARYYHSIGEYVKAVLFFKEAIEKAKLLEKETDMQNEIHTVISCALLRTHILQGNIEEMLALEEDIVREIKQEIAVAAKSESRRKQQDALFEHYIKFGTLLNEENMFEMSEQTLLHVLDSAQSLDIRYRAALQLVNLMANLRKPESDFGKFSQPTHNNNNNITTNATYINDTIAISIINSADVDKVIVSSEKECIEDNNETLDCENKAARRSEIDILSESVFPFIKQFSSLPIESSAFTVVTKLFERDGKMEFVALITLKKRVREGNYLRLLIKDLNEESIALQTQTVTERYQKIRFSRVHTENGVFKVVVNLYETNKPSVDNIVYSHMQFFAFYPLNGRLSTPSSPAVNSLGRRSVSKY